VESGEWKNKSSELTILASAPVKAATIHQFFIKFFLAPNTQTHAGYRLATGFGDRCTTFFTPGQALTTRQTTAGALHGILNGRVDLILHCTVAAPTTCHDELP
jgi:hypothetical protein